MINQFCRNYNRHSTWCGAFTPEQLKLLEYGEDLKSYYSHGYGNVRSKTLGCPLARDMFDRFERAANGI